MAKIRKYNQISKLMIKKINTSKYYHSECCKNYSGIVEIFNCSESRAVLQGYSMRIFKQNGR